MRFIILILLQIPQLFIYSQCYNDGYQYNVGAIIPINGVKKRCACIIEPVTPYQPCNSAWVDVSNPAPRRTPPPIVVVPPLFPLNKEYTIQNIENTAFEQYINDNYYLQAKFLGKISLTFYKTSLLGSYNDFLKVKIYGFYKGICTKIKKSYFGEQTELKDNISNVEKIYYDKWINQNMKIDFKAQADEFIYSNTGEKIGVKFKIYRNVLNFYTNGVEDRGQGLDLNKLSIDLYFEKEQTTKPNSLPISIWFDEKGILNQLGALIYVSTK